MSDYERIYLQPECCADEENGRLWCEDKDPVECDDGVEWTEYVRADLFQQLEAENKALIERRQDDIEKAHYAGQRFVKDVPPSTHAAMAYYYGMIDKELLKGESR